MNYIYNIQTKANWEYIQLVIIACGHHLIPPGPYNVMQYIATYCTAENVSYLDFSEEKTLLNS